MSYWDEDWYEPSEFDMLMDELKDSIRKNVKEEIVKEFEDLRKENELLKEVKENWGHYQYELAQYELKLNKAKDEARTEIRNQKLADLLEDCSFVAYGVDYSFEYIHEKCDKCDKDRQVHFTSPSGKDCKEPCSCSERKLTYYPVKVELYSLHVPFGSDKKELKPIYVKARDSENDYTLTECVDGMDFKEADKVWKPYFKNYWRAVQYCEWKNQKS